ncbi:MAG TPA: sigma factor-like helix-turn-helix DNA-binding protein [Steroidobacter sp.]|uniref:sigma factor-like helix-turn-helix DNA-binding protein n=1 Tax=Steroidobacter sp. TaxID=1978227 RepID=UPI002EDA23FB
MSAEATNQNSLTLGELLYANPAIARVSEKEWLALTRAIAAGDEAALRSLYEKTHSLVFTYVLRLTGDRALTEELVLDVFQTIWCEAPVFDGADGPVLGWIMRRARSHALNHPRAGKPPGRDSEQIVESLRLQHALDALSLPERKVIEATLLNGSSYAELAAQNGEPVGTIRSRIRSGLARLQQAFQDRGENS